MTGINEMAALAAHCSPSGACPRCGDTGLVWWMRPGNRPTSSPCSRCNSTFAYAQSASCANAIDPTIATLRARVAELEASLAEMTEHYVSLVRCGDCGKWNPEQEPPVIRARSVLGAEPPSAMRPPET